MNQMARVGVACCLMFTAALAACEEAFPQAVKWSKLVRTAGQPEPVPEQWLEDREAVIAHDMMLPQGIPVAPPFDFNQARLKSWLPGVPGVARQYFQYLCDREAGEWVLKTAPPQAGLYNARPMRRYSTGELQARYDLEAPVLQRGRHGGRDDLDSGTYFVGEPFMPYLFVEEPRRSVEWQAEVSHAYIRLFGYRTSRPPPAPQAEPMQMIGIDRTTAHYGLTWRGTKRTLDRENSVSGVEMMVFDMATREVIAVRRQFIHAPPYGGRVESNSWLQGETCERLHFNSQGLEDVVRLPMLALPSQKSLGWRQRELVAPLPASSVR